MERPPLARSLRMMAPAPSRQATRMRVAVSLRSRSRWSTTIRDQQPQPTTAVFTGVGLIDGTLFAVGTDLADRVFVYPYAGQTVAKLQIPGRADQVLPVNPTDVQSITIVGFEGNDFVQVSHLILDPANIDGGGGNDELRGGGGGDVIEGGPGNDKIRSYGGDDTILDLIGDNQILGG